MFTRKRKIERRKNSPKKRFAVVYEPHNPFSLKECRKFYMLSDAVLYWVSTYNQDASIVIDNWLQVNPWLSFTDLKREVEKIDDVKEHYIAMWKEMCALGESGVSDRRKRKRKEEK